MRLSAYLWPFPFGARLSWATTSVTNPPLDQARGRAFLLRGNAIIFSRGFGLLCDDLRRAGFWAEDLRCIGDRWACRQLLRQSAPTPIILVGHSCGGRYALHAAARLAQHDVPVDLLVCIDVAFPPMVPGNVRRAINLFRTQRRLYPAGVLRPAPGSPALLENFDLDAPDAPLVPDGLHHLNITASPAVRSFVLARALEAAPHSPSGT
jgi:pimeloyl-ACP methyl ester carboxylesterase